MVPVRKKREADLRGSKGVDQSRKSTVKETTQSHDENYLMRIWQSEIRALKGQKFPTVEEAISAIVGQVLAKLKITSDKKLEGFLNDMAITDKTIYDEVKRQFVRTGI